MAGTKWSQTCGSDGPLWIVTVAHSFTGSCWRWWGGFFSCGMPWSGGKMMRKWRLQFQVACGEELPCSVLMIKSRSAQGRTGGAFCICKYVLIVVRHFRRMPSRKDCLQASSHLCWEQHLDVWVCLCHCVGGSPAMSCGWKSKLVVSLNPFLFPENKRGNALPSIVAWLVYKQLFSLLRLQRLHLPIPGAGLSKSAGSGLKFKAPPPRVPA